MNYLGLDVGDKRIGVAVAQNRVIAGLTIVDNTDSTRAISELAKICQKENIDKIIVGIPEGGQTIQMDKIRSFAIGLARKLNIPVEYIDETLTSAEAERLIIGNFNPLSKEYKEEIDKVSAKLILKQYLSK